MTTSEQSEHARDGHPATRRRLLLDGREVAHLEVADTYWRRFRGLLGTRHVDGALLLTHCSSVHGLGMVIRLDVALLDAELRVVRTAVLPPFGLVLPRRGITSVLEAGHGAFEQWGLTTGSQLAIA